MVPYYPLGDFKVAETVKNIEHALIDARTSEEIMDANVFGTFMLIVGIALAAAFVIAAIAKPCLGVQRLWKPGAKQASCGCS